MYNSSKLSQRQFQGVWAWKVNVKKQRTMTDFVKIYLLTFIHLVNVIASQGKYDSLFHLYTHLILVPPILCDKNTSKERQTECNKFYKLIFVIILVTCPHLHAVEKVKCANNDQKGLCLQRGCCWDEGSSPNCYYKISMSPLR